MQFPKTGFSNNNPHSEDTLRLTFLSDSERIELGMLDKKFPNLYTTTENWKEEKKENWKAFLYTRSDSTLRFQRGRCVSYYFSLLFQRFVSGTPCSTTRDTPENVDYYPREDQAVTFPPLSLISLHLSLKFSSFRFLFYLFCTTTFFTF